MNKLLDIFSVIISFIFHPIWLPFIGLWIFFHSGTFLQYIYDNEVKNIIYLMVIVNTAIFPILLTFYLYYRNFISDIFLNERKERIYAYLGTLLFYFITLFFLLKLNIPLIITRFILGSSIVVIICFIINFRYKISAHMAGWGGLTAAIYLLATKLNAPVENWFIFSVIAGSLVGWARIWNGNHNIFEILSGYFVGLAGIFLVF